MRRSKKNILATLSSSLSNLKSTFLAVKSKTMVRRPKSRILISGKT